MMVSSIVIRRETLLATGGFPEEFGASDYFGEDVIAFLLVAGARRDRVRAGDADQYRMTELKQRLSKRLRPRGGERNSDDASSSFDPQQYFTGNRLLRG